jgi:hypothetical protein
VIKRYKADEFLFNDEVCRASDVTRLETELQQQREAFDRELKAQGRIANDWALECKQEREAREMAETDAHGAWALANSRKAYLYDAQQKLSTAEATNADLQKRLGEAEVKAADIYVSYWLAGGNTYPSLEVVSITRKSDSKRFCVYVKNPYHKRATRALRALWNRIEKCKQLRKRAEAAEARADELDRLLSAETKFHETARQDAKLWERRYLRACALSERVK